MYLDIDEEAYIKKLGEVLIIRDIYFNEITIIKEKAKEIIEFLTKFVEGE